MLVGFRYQVGGDWAAYKGMFLSAHGDLKSILRRGDPGYQFLNWSAVQLGGGIWLVNLACGLIFAWGLFRLVRTQPDPWLSMLVSIPYLVIVVAMGYSRQAVAIGFLMAGFARLIRGASIVKFALYVAVAALFHRTAVVALALAALTKDRGVLLNLIVVAMGALLLYYSLLASSVDTLLKNYVVAQYSSQGAAIRVAQNVIPASIFFLQSRSLGFSEDERKIWRNYSIAVAICLVMLLVGRASTSVDRIALYLLPLQIVMLPRIAHWLVKGDEVSGRLYVVVYCFAVQFVWLNFADNAVYWIPYRFYPF